MNRSWANTPTLFKTGGYFSGLIGKIHVGGPPGTISVNLTLPFYTEKTRDHRFVRAKTSEFLSERGDLPFFLQIDCFDPHRPLKAQVAGLPTKPITADAVTPFSWTDPEGDNFNTEVANYYNCVARLDALVGVILEELRTAGVLENTVIVLWGDNGPPFPRAKPTLYENGTRVPLIIAGPGVTGGQVRDELVSMVDLMPTLCAIGEIVVSKTDQPVRQGRSLMPIL